MAVSTAARSTDDAILVRALEDRVARLTDEISDRFKRLATLTHQHDTSAALVNAERTWHAFAETNAFTLRASGSASRCPRRKWHPFSRCARLDSGRRSRYWSRS
jgi:hypothetical protein